MKRKEAKTVANVPTTLKVVSNISVNEGAKIWNYDCKRRRPPQVSTCHLSFPMSNRKSAEKFYHLK